MSGALGLIIKPGSVGLAHVPGKCRRQLFNGTNTETSVTLAGLNSGIDREAAPGDLGLLSRCRCHDGVGKKPENRELEEPRHWFLNAGQRQAHGHTLDLAEP
jgi:hypothetical protein